MTTISSYATALMLIAAFTGTAGAADDATPPAAIPPPAATVATWLSGTGTVAGQAAKAEAEIASGAMIENSQDKATAQVSLAGFRKGVITLGPNAAFTLTGKPGADAPLAVQVEKGIIEVDVDGTGPYGGFVVSGAAIDVKITGTLFMVERVYRDADYVALIRGKVHVSLRKAVAAKLGGEQAVDLEPRQGVLGSSNGLAAVDHFNNRPIIAADRGSLHNQATEPLIGDGGWESGGPGIEPGEIDGITPGIVDAITIDIEIPNLIIDEIVTTVISGAAADLGAPPPPPGP